MKKLLLLLLPFATSAQDFWTEVAPFSNAEIYVSDISIIDEDVIWVCGQGNYPQEPKWSRSTDGGVTWQDGVIDIGNDYISIGSLHAVSETRAYLAVFSGTGEAVNGIWMTNDGGQTWTQQLGQNWTGDRAPSFVHFWNVDNGITVCDPIDGVFQIYTTADGGANWTLLPEANLPAILPGEYSYSRNFDQVSNRFWFGTNGGRLFHTDASNLNNGLFWQAYQTPLQDFGSAIQSGEYAFKNADEGLLVSNEFNLWRTTNSGQTWTQEFPAGLRNFTLTHVTGTANSYFATGETLEQTGRGSSYSVDGGVTWINLDDADSEPVFPELVKFASGSVGFCVGTYLDDMGGPKHFFRMTDPMNRLLKADTFIQQSALAAIPNPTSGVFRISGDWLQSATVYDISGKAVSSHAFVAGTDALLDLSAYEAGIYLISAVTANGDIQTIKLVKN